MPVVRRKVAEVLEGRRLLAQQPRRPRPAADHGDVPARRAVPDARSTNCAPSSPACCTCRSAAGCGSTCARTSTAATTRRSSTCRATATPRACGCGSSTSSRRSSAAPASTSPRGTPSRSCPGCTSWSASRRAPSCRSCPTPTRTASRRGWSRPPGPGRTRFAEALNAECGEERAAELLRRYGSAFPEGYKADHSPRAAVADLVHLERLGRGAGTSRSACTSRWARLPTSAASRSTARATRSPSPRCCRCCSRLGVEVDRRAAVRAALLRPHPRLDLRLRPAHPQGAGRPRRRLPRRRRARAVPGGVRRDLDRQGGERRVQRAGAGRRAGLAAGDGAARVRQVPAPGRFHLQPGLHGGHPPQQRPHHAAARLAVRGADVARPAARRASRSSTPCWRSSTRRSTRWLASTRTASCAPS